MQFILPDRSLFWYVILTYFEGIHNRHTCPTYLGPIRLSHWQHRHLKRTLLMDHLPNACSAPASLLPHRKKASRLRRGGNSSSPRGKEQSGAPHLYAKCQLSELHWSLQHVPDSFSAPVNAGQSGCYLKREVAAIRGREHWWHPRQYFPPALLIPQPTRYRPRHTRRLFCGIRGGVVVVVVTYPCWRWHRCSNKNGEL